MKRFKYIALVISLITLITSCSSDDDSNDSLPEEEKNFALFIVTDEASGSGLLVPFKSMPSGDIDVSKITNGIQLSSISTTGFGYNGAVYNSANSAGDPGIQKFSLSDAGTFVNAGFLPTQAQYSNGNSFGIVSETKGYYSNDNLSQTAMQIFNPETMQRTGEIDCSTEINSIKDELTGVVATRLGSFVVERGGKVFTAVYFLDVDGNQVVDKSYVAVIDVATDSLDKIIVWDDFVLLGYGVINANYVSVDENDDLYLSGCFAKLTEADGINFRTVRIKNGSTDFDATWDLNSQSDLNGVNFGIGGLATNGKLYVRMMSTNIPGDFTGIRDLDYYAYEIDIATKAATKITDIPAGYWKSVIGPTLVDGKIYFLVENDDEGKAYFYTYDPASKTSTKEITVIGGQPTQLIKF